MSCNKKNTNIDQFKYLKISSIEDAKHITQNEVYDIKSLDQFRDQYVWIKNVVIESAKTFTSKKGNEILKIILMDHLNNSIQGVCFPNDWSPATMELINASKKFDLLIKVNSYQGRTTFNVKFITLPIIK
jgi:hypothetical protein